MTERVLGEKGSKRRKRFLLIPVLLVTALALFWVAGAQAVHDLNFQLDGDVVTSPDGSVGGNTQAVDWQDLFNASGGEITPLPTGFTESDFTTDFQRSGTTFITKDTTTFATGSKDTLPIADWQCNFDNNVNSKIDVMNAYAATYTDPASGHDIVYFALERNVNTGDANVAFWFLQGAVACSSSGGAADFSGGHQDGDLLVVSEFSGGGLVSTINVYRWDGDDATGSLNPNPIAEGVDCRNPPPGDPDEVCAAANTGTISTPWDTAAKTTIGKSLPTAQFFEGGLDLTTAGLGDTCINTFIADTRSSTSLTATLFDFARGQLGACESTLNSTQTWLPNDSATVGVTGIGTWSGDVIFTLHQGSLDCTGTTTPYTQTVAVNQGSTTATTTNGTFNATATQSYSWDVVFDPSPASEALGVTGKQHCESTGLTITN
jgi:hypothetical protein